MLFLSVCLGGCATVNPAVGPGAFVGLRVAPEAVTMEGDRPLVVLAVVEGVEQMDAALPLVWEVADTTLGRFVTSSGLTAVYRRAAGAGENLITVRDQLGNRGQGLIRQEPSAGAGANAGLTAPVAPAISVVEPPPAQQAAAVPVAVEKAEESTVDARISRYTLLVGDEISLEIFREPDLSGSYRIEQGGMLRHALFGSVEVAGLTVAQAEASIAALLRDRYLVNPRVTVRVVASQASQVLVMGEVKSPGPRQIAFDERTTLLEIIAAAGGFTELASVNRVRVIRQMDGRQRQIRVRVGRIMSGSDPDFEILPNDVVMVPQTFF